MSSENPETRERILKATWQLMEKKGGRGVRMSDIATASNLSRQAVYLHFGNRAELLIATTHYLNEVKNLDRRLMPTMSAKSGVDRLRAYVLFWGEFLPEIHGVAKALMEVQESDEAAAAAWQDRMQAVRDGCDAVIRDLKRDGMLTEGWTIKHATDLFAAMLSVRVWEQLTKGNGWSTKDYIRRITLQVESTFVKRQ